MKLVSRKVPKNLEEETVSLLPEDPEDMVSRPIPQSLSPCLPPSASLVSLSICKPRPITPWFPISRFPFPVYRSSTTLVVSLYRYPSPLSPSHPHNGINS
jgi:hypothetical protein